MIPYVHLPSLPLGPLHIEPFGVFVTLGVFIAIQIARRLAVADHLAPQVISDFSFWALLGGVIGGHWVHLFAYHPEELAGGWLQIFKVWDGLSSTGGVVGSIVAAAIFFRVRHVRFFPYGDAFALATAVGWSIARVGCFFVHDHPGIHSTFFLAVAFPDGPRHDLGLYDALLLAFIAGVIWVCRAKGILRGAHLGILALLYGIGRFCLDFLRAQDLPYVDARYFGLTPAQYACFALVLFGIWRLLAPRPPIPVPTP